MDPLYWGGGGIMKNEKKDLFLTYEGVIGSSYLEGPRNSDLSF